MPSWLRKLALLLPGSAHAIKPTWLCGGREKITKENKLLKQSAETRQIIPISLTLMALKYFKGVKK